MLINQCILCFFCSQLLLMSASTARRIAGDSRGHAAIMADRSGSSGERSSDSRASWAQAGEEPCDFPTFFAEFVWFSARRQGFESPWG